MVTPNWEPTSIPMSADATKIPSPARSAAGKANRAKRRGLTEDGRQRLREAAFRNKPWQFSSGPRTPEGKAKAAQNGRQRQAGTISVRQLRAELCTVRELAKEMTETRTLVCEVGS